MLTAEVTRKPARELKALRTKDRTKTLKLHHCRCCRCCRCHSRR